MAYLKPQTPLKDLNSGDYFYPLTTIDLIIAGTSRLSAFLNESNNNLLNLTNIGTITSTGKFNLNGDLEIPNNHSFIGILGSNSSTNYTNVGGLTWFNLYGTAGAVANVNDTPTSEWWYIIRNRHTNTSNNYYTDLAIPFNSPSIYYKRVTGNYGSESILGNRWIKVLDDDNYSSTLDNRYVTLGTNLFISGTKIFTTPILINTNGNTLAVGSLNNGWCHFENSANIPFYFSHLISVNGNLLPYTNNNRLLGDSSHYWNKCYATNFYGSLNGKATTANMISHSTYYYNGNVLTNSVGPTALFGESPTANYVFPAFMQSHPKIGGYADVLMWTGYCKWGGTLLAAEYDAMNPRLAIRKMVQGGNLDNWGNWRWVWCEGLAITSAVWNDYAEYRASKEDIKFGLCLYELGDDTLAPTTERLQACAGIASDTWGFSLGETDIAKTPIAVAGRVLAYPYRNRDEYLPGDVLCAAPNGTVDIMTREEITKYPDRIVGIVSCVPVYEEWGGGESADREPVKVNGRIWVHVR